jgi:hypothetical protein
MHEFFLLIMAPFSSIDSLVVGSAANGALVSAVRVEKQVAIAALAG